jgi:hypothetical protein
MRYAQLFCRSGNIGDDIQSLAASAHFPCPPSEFVDRERIHQWRSDGHVAMIMNGWFSLNAEAWPPAPAIHPIFVGFHVTERMKPIIRRNVDYLRRYEPIGTRDAATTQFLRSLGVKAETTYCLTLTFPTRRSAPPNGKVYIVDAEDISVPSALRKGAVKLRHAIPPLDYRVTLPCAQQLLDTYRDTARLVITTRLHAALPCIAMGIPVVFFGDPKDGRTSIVREVGGIVHQRSLHLKSRARGIMGKLVDQVDWSPAPLDVSQFKARLAAAVSRSLDLLS